MGGDDHRDLSCTVSGDETFWQRDTLWVDLRSRVMGRLFGPLERGIDVSDGNMIRF